MFKNDGIVVSDFCTSIFPNVMDNNNTSISSGFAARASNMASISSTPYIISLISFFGGVVEHEQDLCL